MVDYRRESLQVMDDKERVALVETKLSSGGAVQDQLVRHQYSNHLGTATLELDTTGAIISYEEYYPFGSTSFQSGRTAAEVSLKRYRFTGKERDEESGFYYHGARYYIPWLCRWAAVDPLEQQYSPWSSYNYGFNNPVKWTDSTGMGPEESWHPPMRKMGPAELTFANGMPEVQHSGGTLDEVTVKPVSQVGLFNSETGRDFLNHNTVDNTFVDKRNYSASWYLNNALPDPGTIGPTQDYSFPIRARFWLSQQSILSPFAWATGHAAPPNSAANDLATSLTYLMPGIGLAKAATESGLGITSGEANTGDWINLGLSTLSYRNVLAESILNPGRNFVPVQNAVGIVTLRSEGRVFWSGGYDAMNAAMNYAKANGMTTLEMTRAGHNLTKLTQGMPWEQARPMW